MANRPSSTGTRSLTGTGGSGRAGRFSDSRDTALNFVPGFYFSFRTENSAEKKVMRLSNKIKLVKLTGLTDYVVLPSKDICYEQ